MVFYHQGPKRRKRSFSLTAYFPVSWRSLSLSQRRNCKLPSSGSLSFSYCLPPQSGASVIKQCLPLPSPPPLSWFLHPWDLRQWPNSLCHAMPWHLKPLGRGTPIFFCCLLMCQPSHNKWTSPLKPVLVLFTRKRTRKQKTKLAFIYLLVRDRLASMFWLESSLFFCINICDHLIITTDARGMTWVLFKSLTCYSTFFTGLTSCISLLLVSLPLGQTKQSTITSVNP